MRKPTGAAFALTLFLSPPGQVPADVARSVVAVRVVSNAGEVRGTAVLVHRHDRAGVTSLSFLTSARLFRGPAGEDEPVPSTIELRLDEGRTVALTRHDVAVGKGFVNVAILNTNVVEPPPLQPVPLLYDPLPISAPFSVAAVDETGRLQVVGEHVRFRSTLLLVGDRDAAELMAWIGAPAIASGGVIGTVRECETGRPPVISLLSPARSFIERHLPR